MLLHNLPDDIDSRTDSADAVVTPLLPYHLANIIKVHVKTRVMIRRQTWLRVISQQSTQAQLHINIPITMLHGQSWAASGYRGSYHDA